MSIGASIVTLMTCATHRFFGLLELDPAGTVLYSRAEVDADEHCPLVNLAGRNFYNGDAPFKNIEAFRCLLEGFIGSSDQAGSKTFVCEYEDGDVPVRVLLARICERADGDRTKAILVHIRKMS